MNPPLRGIVQLTNSAALAELEFHNKRVVVTQKVILSLPGAALLPVTVIIDAKTQISKEICRNRLISFIFSLNTYIAKTRCG